MTYNSFPPSSGPHYQQPAPWGIYEDPIKQTILVHNLEHGGIVIQYGDVGEETVKDIQSFYQDDPYGARRRALPEARQEDRADRVERAAVRAATRASSGEVDAGNGYVLTCTQWDADAAAKFRDERRNKAGERYAQRAGHGAGLVGAPGYPSAAGVAKLVIRA